MDEEVIRAFLVSVGVDVDENGVRNFGHAINNISKQVGALAATAKAMALAVEAAMVVVADQFDDLYYASQRLRASVSNIKAFSFGVSQMGGDAKSARQSLEGLADAMRTNPGTKALINSLGVATGGRDTTDVMRDLGEKFRAMPYYIARQRADQLGIDPSTLDALIRGTDLWSDQYKEMAGNLDAAAEASARFMQQVRLLRAQFEVFLFKALLKVQEALGPGLLRAAHIAMAVLNWLGRVIEGVLNWLGKLDKATDGWSTAIMVAVGWLGTLLLFLTPVQLGIAAIAAAIIALIDDFVTWRNGGDSLINWDKWSDEIDQALAGFRNMGEGLAELGGAVVDLLNKLGPMGKAIADAFGKPSSDIIADFVHDAIEAVYALGEGLKAVAAMLRGDWKSALAHAKEMMDPHMPAGGQSRAHRAAAIAANDNFVAPAAAATSRGVTGSAADAMNYFQRMGWTREQAAGIVANLQKESGLNAGAVGDGGKALGIAQWHPDRQAEFKRVMGKDIRNSTFAEQLAFVQHELTRGNEVAAGRSLRGATTARQAGGIVSSQYERPLARSKEMADRGALAENMLSNYRLGTGGKGGATVQQTTNITVNGATDPKQTAKHVETAADRANSRLVRNTKVAVR